MIKVFVMFRRQSYEYVTMSIDKIKGKWKYFSTLNVGTKDSSCCGSRGTQPGR